MTVAKHCVILRDSRPDNGEMWKQDAVITMIQSSSDI